MPVVYDIKYQLKVKSCYPKNDWDSSLHIGPYTSITSGSYISPQTFLGKVSVVGDVDLSKLRCDVAISANAYLDDIPFFDPYSGQGGGTVTVSGSGKATVTMESKECDDKEGIVLSPETGDIKVKSAKVDSCDLDLTIMMGLIPLEVGNTVCDILKSDPFNMVEGIADKGADAASHAIKEASKTSNYLHPRGHAERSKYNGMSIL